MREINIFVLESIFYACTHIQPVFMLTLCAFSYKEREEVSNVCYNVKFIITDFTVQLLTVCIYPYEFSVRCKKFSPDSQRSHRKPVTKNKH